MRQIFKKPPAAPMPDLFDTPAPVVPVMPKASARTPVPALGDYRVADALAGKVPGGSQGAVDRAVHDILRQFPTAKVKTLSLRGTSEDEL